MPPRVPGDEDNFLIRADKNPNTRGAELIGLAPASGPRAILDAARAAADQAPVDLPARPPRLGLPEADVTAALAAREMVVFQGPNANATSAGAHLVLPSAAYVEREGTFTNFEGRVQRFRTVRGAARRGAGRTGTSSAGSAARSAAPTRLAATRAEQVFRALAGHGARLRRHELPRRSATTRASVVKA